MQDTDIAGEHPSEYRFDQYALGELSHADRSVLEGHLEQCARCRDRNQLRAEGMAGFPEVDGARMRERLAAHAHAHAHASARPGFWRRAGPYLAAGGAIACAAAVLVALQLRGADGARSGDDGNMYTLRAKGAMELRIYRRATADAEEMASGDQFYAGDRIRFALSPASTEAWADKQVMVVGVEDSGDVSVYVPRAGATMSAPPAFADDGALAGAVELDDFVGTEWLVLAACPRPFTVAELVVTRPSSSVQAPAVSLPDDCASSSFAMTKR